MPPMTVLVVDDSPAMRRQLSGVLARAGLDAVEAQDGADAWRRLAAMRADAILTDINMPVMDGLKLVALVRAGGAHQRTPIVVITTESADADRRRALALGADGYLVKPVQSRDVVDLVQALVEKARATAA
jgi:two-component system, chemotaxis family, chemotaxis protein CheY